jgi:methylenetetrahydrofolate dehydrogenase (NADP+)/methenyltetrahydrofolate cyclohydrolase
MQLPIPEHMNTFRLISAIDPSKDVDGLHPTNRGLIDSPFLGMKPCTPMGIMTMLKFYNIDLKSKHCVIIGRSNIVGKPIASLLLAADATVTITHSKTKNLKDLTKQADLIVVAIGSNKFLKADMVKPGVVVIDVGINRDGDKLSGDVDFESVSKVAS